MLRHLMRRAILQGRTLGMEGGFLVRYAAVVRELMGGVYPELGTQREAIETWLASEEESFGRTLEQGTRLLEEVIERAEDAGAKASLPGMPSSCTIPTASPSSSRGNCSPSSGLSVDAEGFKRLMDEQRARSRGSMILVSACLPWSYDEGHTGRHDGRCSAAGAARARHDCPPRPALQTRFNGYGPSCSAPPGPGAGERATSCKLTESPFYPAGGGQVSDVGTIECERGDCLARVRTSFASVMTRRSRSSLERGALDPEEPVLARVDHAARHATECNHTATHLLHAALRERLGAHVRQAGSYVGPDKLRFDFSHGQALSAEELRDVEDRVNEWILANDPVRPISTTLEEARRLGAMALFGEKYGDVVRMVQIGEGEYSRELCGGTHVHSTAEIGLFHILSERSSAANVRRIEALTGPAAVGLLRERDRRLQAIERAAKAPAERIPEILSARGAPGGGARARQPASGASATEVNIDALAEQAVELERAQVLSATVEVVDAKALLDVVDRVRGKLPEAAIVLGTAVDGRVHLVASIAPALVRRGVKAGAVVKLAAEVVGGGGGGRDTMAQAGGSKPELLGEAIDAARSAIESALAGSASKA